VPGGVGLVHTIGGNRSSRTINEWFRRYIFPNALLPSLAQISDRR
jgi:cyclopropane-fatty-acyl-phospholipid synthase